ncbi:MAG: hypothetical protein U9O55_01355 [Patescibacteria group bacterium]|nr:hypothetical protein [Patescibacteria group bacterium]
MIGNEKPAYNEYNSATDTTVAGDITIIIFYKIAKIISISF